MNTARNLNPNYFEVAHCSECDTVHDLQVHRYTDEIVCIHCVNEKLARIAREEEGIVGREYDEDYAKEMRWEQLQQEGAE